jgi:hypothetical protein
VGDLQGTAAYTTTFSAGVGVGSPLTQASQAFLNFLNSEQTRDIKEKQAMSPIH